MEKQVNDSIHLKLKDVWTEFLVYFDSQDMSTWINMYDIDSSEGIDNKQMMKLSLPQSFDSYFSRTFGCYRDYDEIKTVNYTMYGFQ